MTWRNTVGSLALAGAVAALLFGAPAAAADKAPPVGRIQARIEALHLQQPASVHVELQGREAVLSGSVATVHDLRMVERAARKETKRIVDNVTVQPAASVADASLGKAIEKAILRYPYYNVFDAVGYTVTDGKVVLTGSVNQPYQKSDIDDSVARIVGVRALESRISVQPPSPFDDRLRQQVYRLIYGNQVFNRFAVSPDPPIRIIVDSGHVTLQGVVGTKLERQLAVNLASQVSSFGPVKNEVTLQKAGPRKTTRSADVVA